MVVLVTVEAVEALTYLRKGRWRKWDSRCDRGKQGGWRCGAFTIGLYMQKSEEDTPDYRIRSQELPRPWIHCPAGSSPVWVEADGRIEK